MSRARQVDNKADVSSTYIHVLRLTFGAIEAKGLRVKNILFGLIRGNANCLSLMVSYQGS